MIHSDVLREALGPLAPHVQAQPYLAPLPHALLQAQGEDAEVFLHGQLSSDVAGLARDRSQLSSYNSPKGRALALPRLFREGEGLALRLPAEIAEATVQRLRMFILRSKVVLELTDWVGIGIAGEGVTDHLTSLGFVPPEVPDGLVSQDELRLLRVPGETPRFELWGSPASVIEAIDVLKKTGLTATTSACWELDEIRAGLPEVYAATREAFVPQMLNLHRLGGVSFTKGCYPGQEVVARMHYLGKLKRRLFRIRLEGEPPAPADNLRDPSGAAQGQIVRAAPVGSGSEALAVIALSAVEQATPLLLPSGIQVELQDLPYAVDDQA